MSAAVGGTRRAALKTSLQKAGQRHKAPFYSELFTGGGAAL